MTNHHDIFRNKRDFAHEEFATEMYKPKGRPRPRETMKNPYTPEHVERVKGKKVPFHEKIGSPNE